MTINVDAQTATLDQPVQTGLTLQGGETLQITAPPLAMWHTEGPDNSNAGGLGNPYGTSTASYRDPATGQKFNDGSLVGRIGNGPYFFVGTEYQSVVSGSGALVLVTWDNNYHNNFGTIPVTVTVTIPQVNCVPPTVIDYQWTTPFQLDQDALISPTLVVPLADVAVGTYNINLKAYKSTDPAVFSTASLTLTVQDVAFSVSVSGGMQ